LIPLAFSGEHLSVSGENFDHRKDWIPDRLRELASVFAIEVCGYSVMSNHFHVRSRGGTFPPKAFDPVRRRAQTHGCAS
jgi:hypothetical protein